MTIRKSDRNVQFRRQQAANYASEGAKIDIEVIDPPSSTAAPKKKKAAKTKTKK
jgi:hypothetical protein